MGMVPTKKSSWPQKKLVVISNSNNVNPFLRDLVRSLNWQVLETTPLAEKALDYVCRREAFLLIIEDSYSERAATVVRKLMTHPAGFSTPLLILLGQDHQMDKNCLKNMSQAEVVDMPIAPSVFVPTLKKLIANWESKTFTALRGCFYKYVSGGNAEEYIEWLTKLSKLPGLEQPAGLALSLLLRKVGRLQDAELLLLEQLKKTPRSLGLIVGLSDFYLNNAMPHLAHRLYLSAHRSAGGSYCLMPDIIQADFMLGNLPQALAHLEEMERHQYMTDQVAPMIARIYMSQGRQEDAKTLLKKRKGVYRKILKNWDLVS